MRADRGAATLDRVTNPRDERYELFYWPGIPGRGEFVRLVFEDAGVPYVDVGLLPDSEGGGAAAVLRLMAGEQAQAMPFAPPALRVGDLLLWQTAHICHWLGCRLGLAPEDPADRLAALSLELTLADWVLETHDSHHPIAGSLYYEDQKAESARRAERYREERMPRFLSYFERVLERNQKSGGRALVGTDVSHVDLSTFHVLEGLEYAFPNALARLFPAHPRLAALRKRVAERPGIAAYLGSERRMAFNQSGIFRHYPELDPA